MLVFTIIITLYILPIECHPIESTNSKGDRDTWRHERIAAGSDNNDMPWREELDLWLSDFENGRKLDQDETADEDYAYMMQADEPIENRDFESTEGISHCVLAEETSSGACVEPQCSSDEDCHEEHYRCCFNGCVNICSHTHRPAPLIDWIVQPRPKSPGSSAWLVDSSMNTEDENNLQTKTKARAFCTLNGRIVPEGKTFSYEHHICHCHKKQITCRVTSTKHNHH